jgi:Domain of unknown function (DUF1902)
MLTADPEIMIVVEAFWDDEASVWVAKSDAVPGLATEAETLEGLIPKLRVMIPELVAANQLFAERVHGVIGFELVSRRAEKIKVA